MDGEEHQRLQERRKQLDELSSSVRHQTSSFLLPSFYQKLESASCVLIAGCGGGFDFLHSMLLYPELLRMGKKIVILSYSFGVVKNLQRANVVYEGVAADGHQQPQCKLVTKETVGSTHYQPEIGLRDFLDKVYPENLPHEIYACYARAWTTKQLAGLYEMICEKHGVDSIVVFDGGSDSLMVGDEAGLGDPLEDAVSVGAAAICKAKLKSRMLISVGFGSDRFNDVSDVSSLRAVAELTAKGGFLGCLSIEPTSVAFRFYESCIDHVYSMQKFRSVLTALIRSSVKGEFGHVIPKEDTNGRIAREGQAFVWPLMAQLWSFDCEKVAERSLVHAAIKDCSSAVDLNAALDKMRAQLKKDGKLRNVEDFPLHKDMACNRF